MDRLKVGRQSSNSFVLVCLILLSAVLAFSEETDESSGSGRPVWNIDERNTGDRFHWNEDSVEVKVGSNLSLSCLVDALDLQYEVFRISLIQGDVLFHLVENGLVHSPFSNIPRYSAAMNEGGGNGGARMTIHVQDVQPEDAGTYICSKYLERDNSAVLNITVLAPISDLYITSMDPDGEEMRMDAESEVFLQEHDFYGVGCIATLEGSQTPPRVRVEIDGIDETESFQAIHQVDASILQSGLTLWTSHLRLALVSPSPNPDYNEKLMRCVASQKGYEDVETTTRLLVQFAPLIQCVPERLVARQGTSATLDCNIRANPGSRITWSSARGDLSNYPNVFFDETVIGSDETRLRLSIRNIRLINFQRYTLTAANIIASSQSTFELVEDETVALETQPEVESLPPDNDRFLPEVVEEVFPDGGQDLPAMDADWVGETTSSSVEDKRTVAPAISTSSDVKSTLQFDNGIFLDAAVPNVNSTSSDVKSTLPDVKSTLPDVKSTLKYVDGIFLDAAVQDVKGTLPDVKGILPDVKSTLSDVKSILPDVKSTFQDFDSTLPVVRSTSPTVKRAQPSAKRTLPPVKSSSPHIKTTSTDIDLNLPDLTTVSASQRSISPSGKPHSGGRARSAHNKGTSIPQKASRNALSMPASAAPTKAPQQQPSVAASFEEVMEEPLPAAAAEVHYSLSRSSSSSSKKDSGKSGKSSKSTSCAHAPTVVQSLLATLLVIHWF